MKEEIFSIWAALARLYTSHGQADQEDHEAEKGGDDGGDGEAVRVLHQDCQTDHCHHVDNGPDGDWEPGDGEDSDPDGEDGGEDIAPSQNIDAEQTDAVDLLSTGVVQTAGDQVGGEDNALAVVASVGRQHDGRQHGEVGSREEEAGNQEMIVRHGLTGVVTSEASVPSEAGAGGVEDAGGEVGVAMSVPTNING